MSFYCSFTDLKNVINVFDDIIETHKNVITFTILMQTYLKNNNNEKVLEIYNGIDRNRIKVDSKCHLLAMKACYNLKEIYLVLNSDVNDIEFKVELIDFYGNNNFDIDNALNIYNSISDNERNNLCTNAILSVYINDHSWMQLNYMRRYICHRKIIYHMDLHLKH